jgi:hypothetical protein
LKEPDEETFVKVKKYLLEEYHHPFDLTLTYSKMASSNSIQGNLIVTNTSPDVIKQGTLDIVVPTRIGIGPQKIDIIKIYKSNKFEYISSILPTPIRDRFKYDNEISRFTYLLEDFHGLSAFETPFNFTDNLGTSKDLADFT